VALQIGRDLNAPIHGRVSQLTVTFRGVAAFEDGAACQARQFGSERRDMCKLMIEWLFVFLEIKILNG